ncbi:hypothetical protein ACTI_70950 [Actinoplanes sp. OR16]|nr:hypothetical protein ACTI_70950 [Actinoplanes sp. OR16]
MGILRNASISRLYGRTEARTATTAPIATTPGSRIVSPASATPNGSMITADTATDRASPSAFGKRWPTRALSTM